LSVVCYLRPRKKNIGSAYKADPRGVPKNQNTQKRAKKHKPAFFLVWHFGASLAKGSYKTAKKLFA
jgi:hypothetical protein